MLSTPILLDYQSSTPCSKDVVDSMKPFWSEIFLTLQINLIWRGLTQALYWKPQEKK